MLWCAHCCQEGEEKFDMAVVKTNRTGEKEQEAKNKGVEGKEME